MSGSKAQRSCLLEALIGCSEVTDDGAEVRLGCDLSATVAVDDNGFCLVTLRSAVPPGFTNVNDANARVVGPARWIVNDESLGIRVDLPPKASRQLVNHGLSHALELAGWPAPPLRSTRVGERLAAGRRRLERSLEQLGVDPSDVRRLDGGFVIGYPLTGGGQSELASDLAVGRGLDLMPYCQLHLVEDRRGVVWLRASAIAGAATAEQVIEINSSACPVMTRQVIVDTGADDWDGDPDMRHVVSVADVDLSDASPLAVSSLIWAVATFASGWRQDDWRCDTLPLVPLAALDSSPSSEPLEVVDWRPTAALLVPDAVGESSLAASGLPTRRSRRTHRSSGTPAHDPSCRFHTPRRDDATGTCTRCDLSLQRGGQHLLEHLRDLGVVTEREYREIDAGLDAVGDPTRHRQAETRLAVKVAQRAPIRDLTELDPGQTKARLAELVGTNNPSYTVGCEILDMLVVDGLNDGILLVGDAGSGKSALARHIATVVGMPAHVVSLGSTAGRHTISGSDPGFRNPDRGAVVGGIVAYGTTQLLLVLDELEKLAGHSGDNYPLASVLAMLDDQRAEFTDWFLGSEPGWQINLRSVLFVATANDKTAVPEPVRSRMRIIDMPAWTFQHKLDLARREAARFEHELGLRRPIDAELLEFIVGACPQPGIRELLRSLRQYRTALVRSSISSEDVDPLALFPPAEPTPISAWLRPAPPAPGVTRSVALTPQGWQELRCTATPNGTRWAGSIDALGTDADTFVLHWVPMLEAALGTRIPPCTLHLDPPTIGPHRPTGLSVALLAAVASAVTGLAPTDGVIAPLRSDPHGRLTDVLLSPADLAGLTALGVDTVAVAATTDGRGLEWERTDLPATIVVADLVELIDLLVPGTRRWERPPGGTELSGYI